MKRIVFLLVCVLSLLVLTGCGQSLPYTTTPGILRVTVEDGGEFPESIVGRWEADKDGWGFIFEPGGSIFVARISMGRTNVMPGKVTTLDTYGGGKAVYVPGDWHVIYSPLERELIVDMVMNYIRIEMGDKVFQGKTRDIVAGTVSKDGKQWRAVVSTFPEYEGFPIDPNDLPVTKELIFTKIVEEK